MASIAEAVDAALSARQDAGEILEPGSGFSVTTECEIGNEFDGRLGLRISSIFVILIGSLLGAVLPIILARGSKMKVNGKAFFVAKYFGSGVIIGTAFMHLLSPAFTALNSVCLPDGPIKDYDWAAGIALITVFLMFTIELVASRFDLFGSHSHGEDSDPSLDVLKKGSGASDNSHTSNTLLKSVAPARGDIEANLQQNRVSGSNNKNNGTNAAGTSSTGFHVPGLPNDVSYPPGGEDHLGHQREHGEEESHSAFAAQMTALFVLEFGVVFHSVFIGLTLAVAGEEFTVLYVVLVFHQTFEGLGLGSRLATAPWPRSKSYMPYLLGVGYAVSTPIAIAIGLGLRYSLQPGSPKSLIINGVFDAISAGILIYTGLVELLAHEFMFNSHMRDAGLKVQLFALGCVVVGAGLMAVLAIWA